MTRAVKVNAIDVTDFLPMEVGERQFPLQTVEQAGGSVPDIDFGLISEYVQGGTVQSLTSILSGGPISKQSLLDHDGTNVYFAGRLNMIEDDPGPAGPVYALKGTSYYEDLNKHVGYFVFPAGSVTYGGETFDCTKDVDRVKYLFAVFFPTWDHISYIPGSAYATFAGETSYYKRSVLYILKDIAAWPGTNLASPVAARSFLVSADWAAGITTRYIAYFSLAAGSGASTVDLTGVAATSSRAKMWDLHRIKDPSRMVNRMIVGGPNGEPREVTFAQASLVNVTVQGNDLTRTGSGGTWNAGAFGEQSITSEGGYVDARLSLKDEAFGFSTTNDSVSWDTIRFGIKTTYTSGTTGTVDVIYYGTTLQAAVSTYEANANCRVEVRREQDSTGIYWRGIVYVTQSNGDLRMVYAVTFSYSQMDDGSHSQPNRFPLYPDVAMNSTAATLNDVIIRRHSYNEFSRADSISTYGEFWADDVLKSDDWDTYEKRWRVAEQVFDRRAYPRQTLTCTTDGIKSDGTRYHFRAGKTVNLYNHGLVGWSNPQQLIIQRVTTDWYAQADVDKPLQYLEIGDRLLEAGEEDEIEFLLHPPERDIQAPPIPSGFTNTATGMETETTAWARFTWTEPTDDTRWVWIREELQGPNPPRRWPEYRVPKSPAAVVLGGFMAGRTYLFEIAAEDNSGNKSPYGNGIVVTMPSAVPNRDDWNPSFEHVDLLDDTKPAKWTDTVTGTSTAKRIVYAGSGEKPRDGAAYLELTCGVAGDTCQERSEWIPVEPGEQYTLWMAWDQSASANATYQAIEWYNETSSTPLSTSVWLNGHNGYYGSMHFDGHTVTSDANAKRARIVLGNISPTNGVKVYFDDIIFKKSIAQYDIKDYSINNQQLNSTQVDNRVLATITDVTKFLFDIQANIWYFNDNGSNNIARLNYDGTLVNLYTTGSAGGLLVGANTADAIKFTSGDTQFQTGYRVQREPKSSNFTADGNDTIYEVDCTSGDVTVTLPTSASAVGRPWTFIKIDSSANKIILDPSGAVNINGASTMNVSAQYSAKTAWYNGTVYYAY